MKIAVVGAGLGGCSAARFCREEFPDAEIHIYDRDRDHVGGRAKLFEHAGRSYEAGASIIHEKNQYLWDFADEFQLPKLTPPSLRLWLHDGRKKVFEASEWKPRALLQLLWRYGAGPLNLEHWVSGFLRKFEAIYALQEQSKAFTSPKRLVEACDQEFPGLLSETLRSRLHKDGFAKALVEELVEGMVRINYGQGLDVGAFVGAVALCGFVGPLWAVQGGNQLLAEKLVKSASAKLVHAKVTHVRESGEQRRYQIKAASRDKELLEDYDLVFLAAPQVGDGDIHIFPALAQPIARSYQRVFASFYSSPPKGLGSDPAGVILSTSREAEFNSIGQYDSTLGDDSVIWKAFSKEKLDLEKPKALFAKDSLCETFAWWAYPVYETEERKRDIPFCLDGHGLFYCNAIEGAASAMEMAVIGAKNCVLLASNRLKGRVENIDSTAEAKPRAKL